MMRRMRRYLLVVQQAAVFTMLAAGLSVGCAGTPASPFDSMQTAPITAFRLQNYEPPPQVAAAPHRSGRG